VSAHARRIAEEPDAETCARILRAIDDPRQSLSSMGEAVAETLEKQGLCYGKKRGRAIQWKLTDKGRDVVRAAERAARR